MRRRPPFLCFAIVSALAAVASPVLMMAAQRGVSVLFIGNSFTFGDGSPVRFYRSSTVDDLNGEGIGGVPALFKSFTAQAGLDYDVSLETHPGAGFEFHLKNKFDVLGSRPWQKVVMQGQSTLDLDKPGDATKIIATSRQLAEFLRQRNPDVELYLMATWSRADQTYPQKGAWFGKPIEAMARDVRAGVDKAAAGAGIKTVIPVGEAWTRAMQAGVADPNPYDGIEAGKLDLWTYDHYHASTAGYYLEALVAFGSLTGRDPRSLGDNECSGFELGLSRAQVKALQHVAFDELGAAGALTPSPLVMSKPAAPQRCRAGR
ncbi:MAG TPA: SGNH/GDSL hydrolase family protein [Vicinamibacterales bacterium]|nr:SGNH/GDSL hydrolase family protein [Vicinamibacterales bacterium]